MFDVLNQKGNSFVSLSAWVALIIPGARAHEAAASTSRRTVRRQATHHHPLLQTARGRSRQISDLVAVGLRGSGKLLQGLGNDAKTLVELLLGDDERRREADDVSVRWLGLKEDR